MRFDLEQVRLRPRHVSGGQQAQQLQGRVPAADGEREAVAVNGAQEARLCGNERGRSAAFERASSNSVAD